MKINRDNLKWCGRFAGILIAVASADALAILFMRRPFPFDVLIPCSMPILTALFVIIPMTRANARDLPGAAQTPANK